MVDDEPMVREVVERYLTHAGFSVQVAADGAVALRLAAAAPPDLVILDLMLPHIDGLEVCRQLRDRSAVPIIMLTARGDETDKVLGFGLGADDYLVKPFSPRELVARVQAVLRRSQSGPMSDQAGSSLHFTDLSIDAATRQVTIRGQRIELTPREFDLLTFLASHEEQVFTRDQLLDHVWEYGYEGDASTVTVHIRRLREKIEPTSAQPRYIKTVWGVGYKFEG